jgi:hypothetical protein
VEQKKASFTGLFHPVPGCSGFFGFLNLENRKCERGGDFPSLENRWNGRNEVEHGTQPEEEKAA